MERVFLKDVVSNIGNKVKVQGFVENIRDSKAMVFVVLKDITGKVQVTLEKEKAPNLAEKFSEVTPDSVITIVGDVIANEYVKMGGIEIIPTEVEIESIAQAIPIARKEIPATKKQLKGQALTKELTIGGLICVLTKINLCLRYKLHL